MFRDLYCRLGITPLAAIVFIFSLGCPLHARDKPRVGSPNVAIADPPLPAPSTRPCTVQLFPNQDFGPAGENTRMDSVPHTFSYQPPSACQGPWAKVVLVADFSVDAGNQYDRTASIWLDGANIYIGNTEEPSPNFGPSWQVERDLADHSSLLRSPGKGSALINNWVDSRRPASSTRAHGFFSILLTQAIPHPQRLTPCTR
jgi:Peptide N-acetyl-beta-D-glucosaminyl asparaginase amidase A